jgi:hypothetical protein
MSPGPGPRGCRPAHQLRRSARGPPRHRPARISTHRPHTDGDEGAYGGRYRPGSGAEEIVVPRGPGERPGARRATRPHPAQLGGDRRAPPPRSRRRGGTGEGALWRLPARSGRSGSALGKPASASARSMSDLAGRGGLTAWRAAAGASGRNSRGRARSAARAAYATGTGRHERPRLRRRRRARASPRCRQAPVDPFAAPRVRSPRKNGPSRSAHSLGRCRARSPGDRHRASLHLARQRQYPFDRRLVASKRARPPPVDPPPPGGSGGFRRPRAEDVTSTAAMRSGASGWRGGRGVEPRRSHRDSSRAKARRRRGRGAAAFRASARRRRPGPAERRSRASTCSAAPRERRRRCRALGSPLAPAARRSRIR